MKDNYKENGFTFTETLIASMITFTITLAICICFSSLNSHYLKNHKSLLHIVEYVNIDYELRNKISRFAIPYYSKSQNEVSIIENEIEKYLSSNLINIKHLRKNNKLCGLCVQYQIENRVYEVKEFFASIPF